MKKLCVFFWRVYIFDKIWWNHLSGLWLLIEQQQQHSPSSWVASLQTCKWLSPGQTPWCHWGWGGWDPLSRLSVHPSRFQVLNSVAFLEAVRGCGSPDVFIHHLSFVLYCKIWEEDIRFPCSLLGWFFFVCWVVVFFKLYWVEKRRSGTRLKHDV